MNKENRSDKFSYNKTKSKHVHHFQLFPQYCTGPEGESFLLGHLDFSSLYAAQATPTTRRRPFQVQVSKFIFILNSLIGCQMHCVLDLTWNHSGFAAVNN